MSTLILRFPLRYYTTNFRCGQEDIEGGCSESEGVDEGLGRHTWMCMWGWGGGGGGGGGHVVKKKTHRFLKRGLGLTHLHCT